MTPEKESNTGSDDAAVALEEEKPGQAAVADSVGGKDSAKEDTTTAEAASGPVKEATTGESPDGDSVKKAEFQEVSTSPVKDKPANLDLLLDVVVPVAVELGRTTLTLKDILAVCQGSVIELDRAAGESVDIIVGGRPLARGEVVVVKDRFGVRITELVGTIEGVGKA